MLPDRFSDTLRRAWQGRVSGCMLGKAVEVFSLREGQQALHDHLAHLHALPLRDYIPYDDARTPPLVFKPCCRGHMTRSEPDDDINYSVLALMLLEQHGRLLRTEDVARAWLRWLPLASTFTAERATYRTLVERGHERFADGHGLGFPITECGDNPYNDWIGAQIRADVYGWVCPGNPELAADLATRDARLSHRGDGIYGAVFVAALGAILAGGGELQVAVEEALGFIPAESRCADAVHRAIALAGDADGHDRLRAHYGELSPVHTVNNLALVVWSLVRHQDDFDAAVGDVVAAGLDTDCNGATVGALWALQGEPLAERWVAPWQNRVGVSLAGMAEVDVADLVARTLRVATDLAEVD